MRRMCLCLLALTAPARAVRGRACVRPWKLGARAYGGRRRPGVGPRNAYALVSGMRLG